MQEKRIRAILRRSGRLYAEMIAQVEVTNENFAYEIEDIEGGAPFYIADGARHDLSDVWVWRLKEAIKEVRK